MTEKKGLLLDTTHVLGVSDIRNTGLDEARKEMNFERTFLSSQNSEVSMEIVKGTY